MSMKGEHERTLPDEVSALIRLGAGGPDDVDAALKVLLKKFTATSHSEQVEEALQLLGTAVGKQSRHTSLLNRSS